MNYLYRLYAFLFARIYFLKWNKFLYYLSLRGLGILNYGDEILQGEKQWVKKHLRNKQKPVVFDIGANIGNYSKIVYETNESAIIFAFEPHPKTFIKLKNQFISNNLKDYNIHAINSGVGDKNGKMFLFDYSNNDGSEHATLYESIIVDIHKGNSISHEIEIITIDSFAEKNNISKIDLLKIDTEGNEYNVLLGAYKMISDNRINVIHIEFNEMNIESGISFKKFWSLLSNYTFYRVLPHGKLLPISNYSAISCEIYAYQNIVAFLNPTKD